MMFGGDAEAAAHIELKSIGLQKEKCPGFSKKICDFIEAELEVPSDRIYIDFRDIDRDVWLESRHVLNPDMLQLSALQLNRTA